jgi:acid phosphatase type 7
MDPITRRNALALLLAPLAAAGCSFDSILSPERAKAAGKFGSPRYLSASDAPFTLIGAGDPHAKLNITPTQRTGKLLKALMDKTPGAQAFAVGDITEHGTAEEYALYQNNTLWGAFKERTDFEMGNHDVKTDPTGTAYYDYVGALGGERGKGYYAKTYGSWRCYYLNSMRGVSAQTTWLAADLPNWTNYHIMAMWHHPMFASICAHHGIAMTPIKVGPWWDLLQKHGAEFVVTGHVHRYERFARMFSDGTPSDDGIRQFNVGTGGAGLMSILTVHPHSEIQRVARGIIQFDLYPDRYEWKFTELGGAVTDTGVQTCRKVLVASKA